MRASELAETPNPLVDSLAPGAAGAQAQAVPKATACGEDVPWREADAMFKRFVKQGSGVEPPGQLDPKRESAGGPADARLGRETRLDGAGQVHQVLFQQAA